MTSRFTAKEGSDGYVMCISKYNNSSVQGTAERLTMHLVEEHSVVDPTYIEDFLLTYRTFLSSPMVVGKKLLEWFHDPSLRDKVCWSSNTIIMGSGRRGCYRSPHSRQILGSIYFLTFRLVCFFSIPATLLYRDFILLQLSKIKQVDSRLQIAP